jgi:hypothetical protein
MKLSKIPSDTVRVSHAAPPRLSGICETSDPESATRILSRPNRAGRSGSALATRLRGRGCGVLQVGELCPDGRQSAISCSRSASVTWASASVAAASTVGSILSTISRASPVRCISTFRRSSPSRRRHDCRRRRRGWRPLGEGARSHAGHDGDRVRSPARDHRGRGDVEGLRPGRPSLLGGR